MKYVIGLAFLGISAFAGPVTFSTTASQLCVGASGCGVATQTIGGGSGVTVTFAPVASHTVNPNPTLTDSFGSIVISCVGGGTTCGSQSLAGLNLYLNISQSAPSGANGSITAGVMTGSVGGLFSTATITWSVPNTISLGAISYQVESNPIPILTPNTNGGSVDVLGRVTDTSVPEPATMGMLTAGLLGIGLLRKRV